MPYTISYTDTVNKGTITVADNTLNSETTLELSYEFVFSNPLTLKPNIQYVINPGSDVNIPNALMALVRMSYSW